MTNYERIKANVADKEWLKYTLNDFGKCDYCIYDSYTCSGEDCEQGMENWLEKEEEINE